MHRRVQAPAVRPHPEQLDDALVERFLLLGWKVAAQERVVDVVVPQLGDQRDDPRLQLLEDVAHLRRRRLRLEVVEQDVVRLLDVVEAVDVPEAQLDVALERGQEAFEVGRRLRLHPHRPRLGARARHLGAKLGRHADCLVVLAPHDADEGGVVRIRVEGLRLARRLLEQPAGLVRDEALVGEQLQCSHLLGAVRRSGRGHHRLLVPAEDAHDALQVDDRSQPFLQRVERAHGGEH